MSRIKKGDTVKVIAGKDKGKTGKVLKIFPQNKNAIVEKIGLIKKHVRRRREEEQGGILQMEGLIHLSNLMIYCKGCKKAVKIASKKLADGSKSRFCKKCSEII